jgi:hypothetical protein
VLKNIGGLDLTNLEDKFLPCANEFLLPWNQVFQILIPYLLRVFPTTLQTNVANRYLVVSVEIIAPTRKKWTRTKIYFCGHGFFLLICKFTHLPFNWPWTPF